MSGDEGRRGEAQCAVAPRPLRSLSSLPSLPFLTSSHSPALSLQEPNLPTACTDCAILQGSPASPAPFFPRSSPKKTIAYRLLCNS